MFLNIAFYHIVISISSENIDILLKFADDTKLEHNASTVEECEKTQEYLNKFINWNSWNMSFNISKCKVLHVEPYINNEWYTPVEWDLGVKISLNLKTSTQCIEAARRAGAVLTQIIYTETSVHSPNCTNNFVQILQDWVATYSH